MTAVAAPLVVADEPDTRVPFAAISLAPGSEQAVLDVLRSGWLTTGPQTHAFEEDLAAWVGARHAIAVSSCTAAIELSLRALHLPAGTPVLTPTMTFCGAVHASGHAGLRPVFVDCDETLVMSVDDASAAARATGARAMVVQHMGGYPAPVDALAAATGIGLDHIVEDAAHGIGASLGDRRVGTLSRATCFSFYATKNLALGEGGAITTDDDELAAWLRSARLHGMSGDAWRRYQPGAAWRYDVAVDGLKANMTDLAAALGRVQLRHLDHWQQRRAEIFAHYDELLADIPGITLPPRPVDGEHAWHLYAIRIAAPYPHGRDEVAAHLAQLGIGTSVHFIPAHQLTQFRAIADRPMPVADRCFPELLSLPLHAELTDDQVQRVGDALRKMNVHENRGGIS